MSELPTWPRRGRIGIDTETKDPDLKKMGPGVRRPGNSRLVGVSFCIEGGPAHYLPFGHACGGSENLDRGVVLRYLKDQAERFEGDVVGANLPYDLDWLAQAGVEFRNAHRFRDVLVADPLIYELHEKYSLQAVSERWGLPGKDELLLREAASAYSVDPKAGLWMLPPRFVGPYAEEDARVPLQVLRAQEEAIEEQGLWNVYDLECELLPVLVAMRRRGVRIDLDQLQRVGAWALDEAAKAAAEAARLSGSPLCVDDLAKPEPVARCLGAIGVEVPKTTKTKAPSVTADLLESIDHPVAAALRRARKFRKVSTTYVSSMLRYQVDGRVHCTFNQIRGYREADGADIGAAFGRMSSSDPNLQNQPGRDREIGPAWRRSFLPEPGELWCCQDYKAQEPRWTIHYASLVGCTGGPEMAERLRADPNTDPYAIGSEVTGLDRDKVKEITLGRSYGMGAGTMAAKMGYETRWVWSRRRRGMVQVPCDEGAAVVARYDEQLPYVKELAARVAAKADRVGFIVTAGGRRCRFKKFPDGRPGYVDSRKAPNRLIQGSSGDQTKRALVLAEDAGLEPRLQVHDEIDKSAGSPAQVALLGEVMRGAVSDAHVPFATDAKVGPNWGDLSKEAAA